MFFYDGAISRSVAFDELLKDGNKFVNRLKDAVPFSFTYGYGITVWKAQGSEWDKVVLMNEGWPTDKELHRRYLYTGITRAKNKLVVVI